MTEKQFSIKDALRFGWKTTIQNFGLFLGILIVAGIIEVVPNLLSMVTDDAVLLTFTIGVVFSILSIIIQMGFINITLRFSRGETAQFADLFSVFHLFFAYLGASILYALMILGGFLLLIIPGIIWAIKYQFFPYVILDQGLGPVAALRRSGEITHGVKVKLFVFGLVLAIMNLLGFLALVIGVFVTIPLTMVATAFVYRSLSMRTSSTPSPPSQPEGEILPPVGGR